MGADKSSSFHFLSGDGKPGPLRKLLYLACFAEELRRNRKATMPFECVPYRPVLDRDKLVAAFGEQILDRSPSRILCADFLVEELPRLVHEPPAILDLGCGRGNYSEHLRNIVGYRRYLGLDIVPSPGFARYEREDTAFAQANLGSIRSMSATSTSCSRSRPWSTSVTTSRCSGC